MVRPPAIPQALPVKTKKWYTNRVTIGMSKMIFNENEKMLRLRG
jgi:hypothetical protein